ncbi:hypothetical protein D3C73_816570 [compost metagenome]
MHELAHREVHAVQGVVPPHQHHAHRHQGRARQPQQRGQGQHAQSNHPDHLQVDNRRRELERPGEVHHHHFQQHQEQPTLGQECGRGAPVAGFGAVQPGGYARQEDEHRRAQVRQQAREKQERVGGRRVHRVTDLMMQKEGLAHMVKQHDDDDQAAQGVDGTQARGGRQGGRSNRMGRHERPAATGGNAAIKDSKTGRDCNVITFLYLAEC